MREHVQQHLDRTARGDWRRDVDAVLRRPGVPLDRDTRARLAPHARFDLSHVRVHADPDAARSARRVDAAAYTVGHHVAFAKGQYRPGSPAGLRLLAHELAHVPARPAPAVLGAGRIFRPVRSGRAAGTAGRWARRPDRLPSGREPASSTGNPRARPAPSASRASPRPPAA